ncbi:MAG: ParB N-terminal domain-containing protein [Blastocatellia bacterium]|nr:ParB N-terminal domain-containing protein [Blastocatellia bacterium]
MSQPEFVIEYLDPATLTPHEQNFRRHPAIQAAALESSLSDYGWLAAPIVNRRTGNRILDGHARVEIALQRGEATIPVRLVDVTEADEKRILASFDKIGEMRERDDQALALLLAELAETEDGLPAGWSDDDLAALLAGMTTPDFQPVGEDEQGQLDQKAKVTCPECGHQFSPAA